MNWYFNQKNSSVCTDKCLQRLCQTRGLKFFRGEKYGIMRTKNNSWIFFKFTSSFLVHNIILIPPQFNQFTNPNSILRLKKWPPLPDQRRLARPNLPTYWMVWSAPFGLLQDLSTPSDHTLFPTPPVPPLHLPAMWWSNRQTSSWTRTVLAFPLPSVLPFSRLCMAPTTRR